MTNSKLVMAFQHLLSELLLLHLFLDGTKSAIKVDRTADRTLRLQSTIACQRFRMSGRNLFGRPSRKFALDARIWLL